jgi:hypothetical protein
MSDRDAILSALKSEFEPKGYFVNGGNWICCQSCAWTAISSKGFEKAIFWHEQDDERAFNRDGNLVNGLYLAWSDSGAEIVSCLEKAGFKTEWDGSEDTRIKILATTTGTCIANEPWEDDEEENDDYDPVEENGWSEDEWPKSN